MKVLIYGAGSVGLGLASCLIKSGEEVALIGREETVQALRQEGLWRTGSFGNYKAAAEDFICFTSLQDLPNEDYDYVLVCTKTFDTEIAARDISSCRFLQKGHGQVVLCQNGWGNAEIFSTFFPRDRVKNARVITGFIRLQRNQVDITVHADAIHIGNLFGPDISGLGPLARAIDRGGIPSRVTGEICKDLWAKMLYNCNLNALGTLLDVPYGVLGESEETRSIMGEVVAEVFQVMAPAGHSTHWRSPEDYMETFYAKLLPATYAHESSMLQDIRGQRRTEIDALNGAVVGLGKQWKVDVPYNLLLCSLVKSLGKKPDLI